MNYKLLYQKIIEHIKTENRVLQFQKAKKENQPNKNKLLLRDFQR